jgi:sugar (pentulose or hexulose) kinase
MKQGPYLLGIDIGGTGVKAGVFTAGGERVGTGYGEYKMVSDLPGQAEHDAEAWWQATVQAVRDAIRGVPAGEILAIGIGCTNGLVAVDCRKSTESESCWMRIRFSTLPAIPSRRVPIRCRRFSG